MKTQIIGATLIVLLLSSLSYSIPWDKRVGFGGSLALYKMWGGEADHSSLSYMGGLEGRYGLKPYLQVGADINFGRFKPSLRGTSTYQDEDSPFKTTVLPINLLAKVTPLPKNAVKPYALLGAGLLFWNLKEGSDSRGLEVNAGLGYGVGFEWFVTKESVALDFQFRNTHYFGMTKDNTGLGDKNDKFGEFKISLLYYLGGNFDQDEDGIPDKLDGEPLNPEDHDGFQDEDGIPDLDNDNDLIEDVNDGAPLEPEDRDGWQDDDGVPDPDNDGDGILDVDDIAPNAPEDIDGWQDEDGVPDTDNDGDGIPDSEDECPDEAEVRNGFQDEDGCPDDIPLPPIFNRDAFQLEEVTFETGSAELTSDSFERLDTLAESLQDFPEVEIEIRGYTDDVGDAAANQSLSERRAESVRQYLINSGVSADRITAIGFGERHPIADNSTPEGRAQNRRIEMQRVK
jgi:outer membrane protein OmpA-like peptidoglycan-associated protein